MDERLDLISTRWTLLERAHQGAPDAAAAAREHLLDRYSGAVRRYLLGAVKDADAADDLYQDFAYRFLRGDYRGACPDKGRFRDFLKGALSHQVADHCKRQGRKAPNLPVDFPEPAAPQEGGLDQLFLESWRDDLLARAWASLADDEKRTGQPFHGVLKLRVDQPDAHSPELAAELARRLGRPISAAGVRQLLHRARERFAALLRQHVAASLGDGGEEDVDQELRDLGLFSYVRT